MENGYGKGCGVEREGGAEMGVKSNDREWGYGMR